MWFAGSAPSRVWHHACVRGWGHGGSVLEELVILHGLCALPVVATPVKCIPLYWEYRAADLDDMANAEFFFRSVFGLADDAVVITFDETGKVKAVRPPIEEVRDKPE